jgi:hypothetical protein
MTAWDGAVPVLVLGLLDFTNPISLPITRSTVPFMGNPIWNTTMITMISGPAPTRLNAAVLTTELIVEVVVKVQMDVDVLGVAIGPKPTRELIPILPTELQLVRLISMEISTGLAPVVRVGGVMKIIPIGSTLVLPMLRQMDLVVLGQQKVTTHLSLECGVKALDNG